MILPLKVLSKFSSVLIRQHGCEWLSRLSLIPNTELQLYRFTTLTEYQIVQTKPCSYPNVLHIMTTVSRLSFATDEL